jgi:hypothetical protein
MTTAAPPKLRTPARPTRGARRSGYVAAAAINLAILWLLLIAPGWERATFLTEDFARLTGLLTASLLAGVVANVVYLVTDPPWLRRLGDAVTAAFACAVLAGTWVIFPFELTGGWTTWGTTLRAAVGFLAVATAVGVLVNLAALLRLTLASSGAAHRS